jgi:hypothetical protein
MKSRYKAYKISEHLGIRGDLDNPPGRAENRFAPRDPLLAQSGDPLIHTGLRLKRRYAASKPMAGSPMTGSRP